MVYQKQFQLMFSWWIILMRKNIPRISAGRIELGDQGHFSRSIENHLHIFFPSLNSMSQWIIASNRLKLIWLWTLLTMIQFFFWKYLSIWVQSKRKYWNEHILRKCEKKPENSLDSIQFYLIFFSWVTPICSERADLFHKAHMSQLIDSRFVCRKCETISRNYLWSFGWWEQIGESSSSSCTHNRVSQTHFLRHY